MLTGDFPSPLYSELGIEYQQAYSGHYEDLSFSADGTAVIAALKDGKITGFGRPVFAVGKKLKQAFERLYEISPDIYYMDYLEGGRLSAASKFLLQKGLAAKPYYTQVIDLSRTKEELHADIRKSYKSIINNHRLDELVFFTESLLPRFRDLHIKVSGKETRSLKTWQIQERMRKAGEAFSICRWEDNSEATGRFDIGAFFIYNNHTCYYGVGCSVEGASTHDIIWTAILHAKELGCKFVELGEQVFSGDEKLMGISKFKRGFGGSCRVRLEIGERE